jgi:hypothetical protein
MTQGPIGGPGWLDPYIVVHYGLEIANDIFNDVDTPGLIWHATLSQQRGVVLSGRPTCSSARRVVNRADAAL